MKNAKTDVAAEVVEVVLVPIVLVYFIIQPLLIKAFYIPSGSMRPTLVDNDHIMVDKLSYRLHSPNHEDVVVFVAPPEALAQSPDVSSAKGNVYYIKRLIGLPGDVIITHAGYILVNGQKETHNDIREHFGIPNTDKDRDETHVKIESNDVKIFDGNTNTFTTYGPEQIAQNFDLPGASVEFHPGVTIRNGQILDEPFIAEDPDYDFKLVDGKAILEGDGTGGQPEINGFTPMTPDDDALLSQPPGAVPADHVLMMGDNRNDSDDSTHWGPLDITRVAGKARWIFVPIPRIRVIH
jgi:signal peptidase I